MTPNLDFKVTIFFSFKYIENSTILVLAGFKGPTSKGRGGEGMGKEGGNAGGREGRKGKGGKRKGKGRGGEGRESDPLVLLCYIPTLVQDRAETESQ